MNFSRILGSSSKNGMESPLVSIEFYQAPIWVQFWGIHISVKTLQIGGRGGLGEVSEAAIFERSDRSIIIKVKVKIRIDKLIKSGMHIGRKVNGITWIKFRYEKLSLFASNEV